MTRRPTKSIGGSGYTERAQPAAVLRPAKAAREMRRMRPSVCLRLLTAASIFGALAGLAAQQTQQPVFSSRTWLVPIDVRVVDSGGRPIAGLTASDFTIAEDGVPQQVAHFSAVSMTPEPAAAATTLRRGNDTATSLEAPNRRVFLIVFGRGRLQPPAKGVDAALTFVRERLLPQDQVAVFAWNRATDFTTNRTRVLSVLDRFRTEHERIEAELKHWFSGFSAAYKGNEIPDYIQKDIDHVFAGDAAPPMRELAPGRASDATGLAAEGRRSIDEAQRAQLLKDRQAALAAAGKSLSTIDRIELEHSAAYQWMTDIAALTPMALSIDDYIGEATRTLSEMDRLSSAIDYLRFVEGEKHLIYIVEQGMYLPRVEGDMSLAASANEARVTLNVIQTGGLLAPKAPMSASQTVRAQGSGAAGVIAALPGGEPMVARMVAGSIRTLAELTGGMSSIYQFADKGLSRIATATGSGYLLGYYPTNTTFDGRFRRISVKVRKQGATVLYRHGYLADPPKAPHDRRQSITYARIASAVNYPQPLNDLPFRLMTSSVKGDNRVPDLVAEITLDPSRISFSDVGGSRTAELDVTILCQDASDDPAGELWQRVSVRLTSAEWAAAQRSGVTLNVRVPVKAIVASVKVIVYDFASDRLGSAMKEVR